MSVVNASAKAIHAALKVGYYYRFHNDELAHISSHIELSDGEKLVWLNLSARAKRDSNLSCKATQSQIAEMVGKKTNTVHKILHTLEKKGFLVSEHNALQRVTLYGVKLDDVGLEKLSNAPKRGDYSAQKIARTRLTHTHVSVDNFRATLKPT